MKRNFVFVLLLCLGTVGSISAQNFADSIRAFPGAEGYGAWVTGGRGGRVIYVTHTGDTTDVDAPQYQGSLRAALATKGSDPITIMFKCGGVIELKPTASQQKNIKCNRSNMTIAGQTALGDGICVKGFGIAFSGQNIIIRHLHIRPGDYTDATMGQSCLWLENGGNCIIDHCSFSWAVEENMTLYDNSYTTVQWCVVSESLYQSIHKLGTMGYAAQWGGKTATYHHNFLAHHMSRMPRQNGARGKGEGTDYGVCMFDYVNNVHYNWGNDGAFYGGDSKEAAINRVDCNIINNYYIPGPSTTTTLGNQYFVAPSNPDATSPGQMGQWWLEGNVMFGNSAKTNDNMGQGIRSNTNSKFSASAKFSIPAHATVAATTAGVALDSVLANVGATFPKRDAIDARVIGEAKARMAGEDGYHFTGSRSGNTSKNKGIIDSHNDLKPADADTSWNAWNCYAQVDSTQAPLDSDGDGMPDWWEELRGFDPLNPADGSYRDDNDYTNLENYLNREGLNIVNPKVRQTITWVQDSIAVFDEPNILLAATTNSGLPITYTSSNDDVLLVVNGNELDIMWVGDAVITAAVRESSAEYAQARPISKNFTVLAFRPDPEPNPDPTGVNRNAQIPVSIYPNPVESVLNLRFEEEGAYEVKLIDLTGSVIYRASVKVGSHAIDVSSYLSGTYLLCIENAQKKRSVQKIGIK